MRFVEGTDLGRLLRERGTARRRRGRCACSTQVAVGARPGARARAGPPRRQARQRAARPPQRRRARVPDRLRARERRRRPASAPPTTSRPSTSAASRWTAAPTSTPPAASCTRCSRARRPSGAPRTRRPCSRTCASRPRRCTATTCPPGFDDLLRRALSKVPADRHATAGELAAEAADLVEGAVVAAGERLRVVVADDSVLLRTGVVRVLEQQGFEVVAQTGDAEELLAAVREHEPDVVVTDIRMPPTHTDEGLQAAHAIRTEMPGTGVLVLSQYSRGAVRAHPLRRRPRRDRLPAQGARHRARRVRRGGPQGLARRGRARPDDHRAARRLTPGSRRVRACSGARPRLPAGSTIPIIRRQ